MKLGNGLVLVVLGLMLGGCVEATLEPAPETNLKPRDRELLAHATYAQASIPEAYRRHIVDYHRKEAAGTIVVDTDARFLYYVLPNKRAIRSGVRGGERAQIWSGVAKVGNRPECPSGPPPAGEHQRLGPLRSFVSGGPQNP